MSVLKSEVTHETPKMSYIFIFDIMGVFTGK